MLRATMFAAAVVTSALPALADDVVAARTMRIGTIVSVGDVVTRGEQPSTGIDAMIGLEVRRVIYAGRPIARTDLGPPTLVHRNEIVSMVYSVGGLQMRTDGRALGRGGLGEVIDVMTLSSRQKVRATVAAPGRVEVRR